MHATAPQTIPPPIIMLNVFTAKDFVIKVKVKILNIVKYVCCERENMMKSISIFFYRTT